jgi:uncharacterized peroxidase-related enzyme
MEAEYRLSLPFQTLETANLDAKPILEKALKQVGFIPNMYGGMVNSPGLLDTYLHGYSVFRQHSGFSPAEQEVVFLTISRVNGCSYCMAAHSVIADEYSKTPMEVTNAIRDGAPITNAKFAALSSFTETMVRSRGLPSKADVERFLASGYAERHILDIILAIAVKTLSNYSNHLFHTPVDEMFAGRRWTSDV